MNLLHFILLIIIGELKSYSLALHATTTKSYKGHNQNTSNHCNNEIQPTKQLKTKQSQAAALTRNNKNVLPEMNQQRQQLCQKVKSQNQHKNLGGSLHAIAATATTNHIENKDKNVEPRRRKLSKRKVSNPTTGHEDGLRFSHFGYTYNAHPSLNSLSNDVRYVNDNVLGKNEHPSWLYGQQPDDYSNRKFSQQLLYSPKRPKAESKLAAVQSVLPYPPSFITFTTTKAPFGPDQFQKTKEIGRGGLEKPYTSKPIRFQMPDFFANRQFKSLLDSYIPSWQIIKMMHNYNLQQNRNDLQTLAFVMPYKKHLAKRSLDNKKSCI